MLKRINRLLTIITGTSVGVFLGHGLSIYWHHRNYPDLYRTYSAPWYTSILLYGVILLIVLAVCLIAKVILRKIIKR